MTDRMKVSVTASNRRPSSTVDTDGAVDVNFALDLNGRRIEGEVTLKLSGCQYTAWGQPDHWLDGRTVSALRDLPRDDYRTVLAACSEAGPS